MPIRRSHDVDAPPVDLPTASEPFDVLPGSVVKSVRHRWLLKEWELGRARRAFLSNEQRAVSDESVVSGQ